jgi:hypothetical protein
MGRTSFDSLREVYQILIPVSLKLACFRPDQRVKLTLVDAAIGSDCDEEVIVVRKPPLHKKV